MIFAFGFIGFWAGLLLFSIIGNIKRQENPEFHKLPESSILAKKCILIGILLGVIIGIPVEISTNNTYGHSTTNVSSQHKYDKQCKVCGKWFSDDTNKSSIRKTNMCSQCYKNYKYAVGN